MVLASRTDSFIAATITQQTLYDGIKQAFLNAGYNPAFDDYVGGTDKILVYAIAYDTTKTYGTTYLRIRITTGLVVNQQLYSTWVVSSHTGTNPSSEIAYAALANTNQVNFIALNAGIEFKLIVIWTSAITYVTGFIAPFNKPVWWDVNAWNYCFMPTDNTYSTFYSTALNPYNSQTYYNSLNNTYMGSANLQTNRRDLLPGIIFYSNSNRGIAARSSDDLVMTAASGTTRFDTFQVPNDTKQYLLLNPASGGLAVRVV